MAYPVGTTFDRYVLRELIGEGGMGEVYLATDKQLNRPVALKLLSAEATDNPERLQRFIQEARAASALNHPNVITIHEIGEADGINFIAMEYIDGETLRQRFARGRMTVNDAADVAISVATALAAAHKVNVIHRDIKPENIMLRHDGFLKVLDFGLAKLNQNQNLTADPEGNTWQMVDTRPGAIMGTVSYMSPEQARGVDVNERSDIWSLGIVIYEMLTGVVPFVGPTPADVISSILNAEPKAAKQLVPNIPTELSRIVRKSLAKSPDERYQTIADMLLDLRSLQRDLQNGDEYVPINRRRERRSIAILPFTNLTHDTNVNFYEFSLADAVVTELARIRSLFVRPSSVVAKYVGVSVDPIEVGRELKVDAILAASFLCSRDRIRVNTQLIDVDDGGVLWGERIDSTTDDIILVQDTITQRIVAGLQVELSSHDLEEVQERPKVDAAAYEEYLRGRDRMRRFIYQTLDIDDNRRAIEHFESAIKLDPDFPLPYCANGIAYINRVFKGIGNAEDIEKAAKAFDAGLAKDPTIVEGRAFRTYAYRLQGDFDKARNEIMELLLERPNSADVQFLNAVYARYDGDYEFSRRRLDEMAKIDPTAEVLALYNRARLSMYEGKFENAFQELDLAASLEPAHTMVKFFKAVAKLRTGDPESAAQDMESLIGRSQFDVLRPCLGMCYSALGRHDRALEQVTERVKEIAFLDSDVPYWIATLYAMENLEDLALDWFETAIKHGNRNVPWFKANPIWKGMQSHPRFQKLLSNIERSQAHSPLGVHTN